MKRTIVVRCTFDLEVDVPEDMPDEHLEFAVEDNGCPGTGFIGAALEAHIAKHHAVNTCWACAIQGENKIVEKRGFA